MDHTRIQQSTAAQDVEGRGSERVPATRLAMEERKQIILRLYMTENLPLTRVLTILRETYGVQATQRQLKARIKQWGISKTVNREKLKRDHVLRQSISSLTRQSESGSQARESLNFESNRDQASITDGSNYRLENIPRGAVSHAEMALDATAQLGENTKSLGYELPSSAIPSNLVETKRENEEMSSPEQSQSSVPGSILDSISTCSTSEPQTLESEKRRIVDNVMRHFLENMDTYLEDIHYNSEAGDAEDGGDRRSRPSQDKGKGISRSTGCRKRVISGKHVQQRDDGEDNEADDGDDQRDGGSSKKTKVDPEGGRLLRLACPYFKWNPRKYRHHRVCVSPGWESVHRVKEHLYRCHQKPKYQCFRCFRDLEGEATLRAHLRASPLCETVSLPEPCDKFGTETESRLRKRSNGKKSEKDQWIEVYKDLFSVRDEDELPTPYCEDFNLAFHSESWSEHVQREVRPLLRELLATEVAQAITNIAPEILHNLRDLVRQLEPMLRRTYEQSQEQDRDQDDNKIQPEEQEVGEEDDDEKDLCPPAGLPHLIPIPHGSNNIPHALTSVSAIHNPTTDVSTYIPYTSAWTPDAWISDPLYLTTGHPGYDGADVFGQTFNPSITTWSGGVSAYNSMQSGSTLGSDLPNTGGFSVPDQTRLAQQYNQEDATDLQEWSVVGGDLTFDDTNIDGDSLQADFGGGHGASPGGGGPSGAVRSVVRD